MSYFVYIVECADKTLYIGTTNNLEKRIQSHNESKSGAKYTRGRRPVRLVYSEDCQTKNKALSREYVLKKLSREEKMRLFTGNRE
jgi:putative endonuclease